MADQMVAVEQPFESAVDGAEHGGQVDAVHRSQDVGIGRQLLEIEAAAQGGVEQRDGPVGGVHRAEYVEIAGQGEPLAGMRQSHADFVLGAFALVLLQKRDELSENLGNVGAVDLVDNEDMRQGLAARALRDTFENAIFRNEPETGRSTARCRTQSLDEFLVPVGLMKRHEFDAAFFDKRIVTVAHFRVGRIRCEGAIANLDAAFPRGMSFPGTGRAVEYRIEWSRIVGAVVNSRRVRKSRVGVARRILGAGRRQTLHQLERGAIFLGLTKRVRRLSRMAEAESRQLRETVHGCLVYPKHPNSSIFSKLSGNFVFVVFDNANCSTFVRSGAHQNNIASVGFGQRVRFIFAWPTRIYDVVFLERAKNFAVLSVAGFPKISVIVMNVAAHLKDFSVRVDQRITAMSVEESVNFVRVASRERIFDLAQNLGVTSIAIIHDLFFHIAESRSEPAAHHAADVSVERQKPLRVDQV